MASSGYFCRVRGKVYGPFTSGQVRSLAAQGQLGPRDQVRAADSDRWVLAANVGGLFATVVGPRPQSKSLPASETRQRIEKTNSPAPTAIWRNESRVADRRPVAPEEKKVHIEQSSPIAVFVGYGRTFTPKRADRFRKIIFAGVLLAAVGIPTSYLLLPPRLDQPTAFTGLSRDTQSNATLAIGNFVGPSAPGEAIGQTAGGGDDLAGTASDHSVSHDSPTSNSSGKMESPPKPSERTTSDDIAEVQEFLRTYRKLRKSPQLKLLKYYDVPYVEWRCFIDGTSDTGLGWLFGHLPSSKPDELEVMIFPMARGLDNQIWPILQDRRVNGLDPSIEVKVRGRVVSYREGSQPQNRPRVDLADAVVTRIDPVDSVLTSTERPQRDVLDAEKFLADWRSADPNDPAGEYWLSDQLKNHGYAEDVAISWRCILHERTEVGDFRGALLDSVVSDPGVRILPHDAVMSGQQLRSRQYPIEVTLKGRFAMVTGGKVLIRDAQVYPIDDADNVPHRHNTSNEVESTDDGVAIRVAADEASAVASDLTVRDESSGGKSWLVEFAKTTSNKYTDSGFAGFRFGDSLEEVKKSSVIQGELYPVTYGAHTGFLHDVASGHLFFFDNEQLRVIVKHYEGESGAIARRLARSFGSPRHDDLFSVVGQDPTSQTAYERLDAYYFFPKAISRVSAVAINEVYTSSYLDLKQTSTSSSEMVTVSVFDKQWLLPIVEDYGESLSGTLRWINANIRPGRKTELSTLPEIASTRRKFSPLGERSEYKQNVTGTISEALLYEKGQGVFLLIERFNHNYPPEPSVPETGTLHVRIDTNLLPGGHPQIISCGALAHLRGLLHARLAQMYFIPVDANIYRDNNLETGFEFYQWDSVDGWTVEVGPNLITLQEQLSGL